jgi:hypothetical protein
MSSVDSAMTICAEALFASCLQESQRPTFRQVRAVVADTLDRFTPDHLDSVVAQEAGDHPDLWRRRITWARAAVAAAYAPHFAPTQ